MKKPTLNIASNKTQKLIGLLSNLENVDRQRMSSNGKHYLDEIWKLLGLLTPRRNPRKRTDEGWGDN